MKQTTQLVQFLGSTIGNTSGATIYAKTSVAKKFTDLAVEEIVSSGKLKQLAKIFQSSPLLDFSLFVMKCPEGIKAKLLERVDLSLEALQGYLDGSSRQIELIE